MKSQQKAVRTELASAGPNRLRASQSAMKVVIFSRNKFKRLLNNILSKTVDFADFHRMIRDFTTEF